MLIKDEIISIYSKDKNLFHKSWIYGRKVISIDSFEKLSNTDCMVWDSVEHYLMVIRNIEWINKEVNMESLERKFIINKPIFDKYLK